MRFYISPRSRRERAAKLERHAMLTAECEAIINATRPWLVKCVPLGIEGDPLGVMHVPIANLPDEGLSTYPNAGRVLVRHAEDAEGTQQDAQGTGE